MWWWFTARRAHTVLPASLAAFAVLLALLGESAAVLPAFFPAASAPVVLVLAAPVVVCAGLMQCLHSRLGSAEETGVRPVRLLDAALAVAALAAAAVLGAAVGLLADSPSALAAGRNTAFLTGLMLAARTLVGPRAVLLPVAWIMAVAVGGYRYGHPLVWTVVARPPSDPYAAAATALALTGGLLALLRSDHRDRTGTEQ